VGCPRRDYRDYITTAPDTVDLKHCASLPCV
jgi:hypothetical protein